jgi:DNA polymerase III epsilon subunit-like protein
MTDRVMLDIETLGLEPGAAILSIGAVRFDAGQLGSTYTCSISLESCQDAGLDIDAGTLEWWLDQDDDAQDVLTGGTDLEDALEHFTTWLGDPDEVWANSPSFDCKILEHAYEAVGLTVPWNFYQERDYRTLSKLPVAPEIDHDGVKHDALDDAMHQAHLAAATLKRIDGVEAEEEPAVIGGDD